MGAKRSMQRKMGPRPVEVVPPPPAPPQAMPMPENYRVRRIICKAEIDVYNDQGVLTVRGLTDDHVIVESEFPQGMIEYFLAKGFLKDGFKTYKPPTLPEPVTP